MNINDILAAIKIEIRESESAMEGADSDDFIFCDGKAAMLYDLSRELNMILFNKGRTLEEFIPMLRGRVDAIQAVITLIHKDMR